MNVTRITGIANKNASTRRAHSSVAVEVDFSYAKTAELVVNIIIIYSSN